MDAQRDTLSTVLDGYEIIETLYRSSSKVVYHGRRRSDNLHVVMKCLERPTVPNRKRMEREVAFLRLLRGTGVCSELIDFLQAEGVIILSYDGGIVGSGLLEKDTPVVTTTDIKGLLQIGLQLARALNVVHGHRVSHNDMKPRNFLYLHHATTPRVILLDFDLATNFDESTVDSVAVGTIEYMSPEQTGQLALPRDYRTDLYSLGVILYQLCTGHLPYTGNNLTEVFHATISAQPTAVASTNTTIPLVLSNVVMTLLNKNPDQRYQSAFGLAADLERCLNEWTQQGFISSFLLREFDCAVVFRIPRGLFGRENELRIMQSIYDNTRNSHKPRCLLVGGPAGVGKSSILTTLQSGFPGIYIMGKYEANRGESPYFAFAQAFNMLARHLLVLPPLEIASFRAQILAAVGAQGAVLTALFHDLERVIGPQPPVPDLPASEAQNRFTAIFLSFIRGIASPERPLILFLDDMQWVDTSSLGLWRSLLSADVPGLMLVSAYRDNEVPSEHPFAVAVRSLTEAGVPIEQLTLQPIATSAIVSILTAAINISPEDALPLAELLQQKTLGNPFFLNRYSKALYEERLLNFDWRTGKWTYDAEKIASSVLAENAAQLMTESIRKADRSVRDPLLMASTIGTQFSSKILAVVSGLSEEDLQRVLLTAVDQAFIFKVSVGQYRFCHDNVRLSAYSLLNDVEKQRVHLQIGRAMQQVIPAEALEDSLFDLLAHLNAGASLMTDPAELLRLAQLNRIGTQRAIRATATVTAGEYATAGLAALAAAEPNYWPIHHRLAFELTLERATALALNNHLDEALEEFTALAERASTPEERVEVYTPKLLHLHIAGKQRESCEVGVKCLEALGESLPLTPTDAQVDACLAEFDQLLQSRTFEEFANLRAATDAFVIARQRCLCNMTAPSFFFSPNTCALVSARNSLIGLEQGVTPYTGIGLVFLAMVYGLRERFDLAFDVGRLAVALVDRFDDQNTKGKVYFMFGAHINWFRKPISDDLAFLRVSNKQLLTTYDYTYASYSATHTTLTWLLAGDSIDSALAEAKQMRELLRNRLRVPDLTSVVEGMIAGFQALVIGATALHGNYFATGDVAKLDHHIQTGTTALTQSWWLCVKVFGLYNLEQYEEAIAAGKENESLVHAVRGHLVLPCLYYPHYILSLLAVYSKCTVASTKEDLLVSVKKLLTIQNSFARNSPVNLLFIERIVVARYKEVVDLDLVGAGKLYDEAAMEAEKSKSMYWHGIALYLGAACASTLGTASAARLLLREACNIFTSWGAATLVALISRHHSHIIRIHGSRSSSLSGIAASSSSSSAGAQATTLSPFVNLNAQLDAETVLQVARAISQEIMLDKLLSEVMKIITENTSAEFVCLAMAAEGEELEIVSSKHSGPSRSGRAPFKLATADKIAAEIIRFVYQLSEPLLLENAYLDPRFYPEGRPLPGLVRSVLCVPIQKTSVKAVLYMENSTVAAAFSPSRMQIVHAILPQIGISIENATLVKRLTSTSEELKRKNEVLRQEDVRKDQFLAITTHELRTPLHGVIGATSLLLETMPLSSEQQEYASVILGASKSLLTLVNDILDLTKIQSSKVRIEQKPCSVINIVEAALEVVSGSAGEKDLELAYSLGNPLPLTHLFNTDPVRVQQVLTNLLANAIKFTSQGSVLLTISAEGTTDEDMYLRFVVTDTGIGIPPEKIPRLFKMFAQLDTPDTSRYDGYGVGLFICQRLLDLLGGTVTAASDGKTGSTFTVCIPASPVPCGGAPRAEPLPANLSVVLHFVQRQSYATIEQALIRYGVPVHLLHSLDSLPSLMTTIGNFVFLTDLSLAQHVRSSLPPAHTCIGIVVLAYAQRWKLYKEKDGLVPLFRPVQHAKIIPTIHAAIAGPNAAPPPIPAPRTFAPTDLDVLVPRITPPPSPVVPTARSTAAPVVNVPMQDAEKTRLHVLVVEDNLVNSKLLCRILEGTYTTATAINGVEAIKAVQERPPDLILMDIQMPVMDGIAATKEIRKLGYTIPIVAATASFSESDRASCLEAGMNDILPKPFTKPAVLAAVQKNLRK